MSADNTWKGNNNTPPQQNTDKPINVSNNLQAKAGSLTVGNTVTTNQICLGTNCITSWPVGGGGEGEDGVPSGSWCGMNFTNESGSDGGKLYEQSSNNIPCQGFYPSNNQCPSGYTLINLKLLDEEVPQSGGIKLRTCVKN